MSIGDMFNIRDESNIERLVGTINDPQATTGDVLTVQADKSIAAKPGGGSGALPVGVYTAASLAVPTGGNANPDWVFVSGDALLDLTVPNTPEVLTAGVYLVTATGGGVLTTPGGTSTFRLIAYDTPTFDNQIGNVGGTYPVNAAGQTLMEATLLVRMPSTGVFQIGFINNDGVADVNFSANISVSKLSA